LKRQELARVVRLLEKGDWRAAHEIVQKDEKSPLACWAHGIVHLMEGDVPNARYWYGMAKRPFSGNSSIPGEIAALKDKSGSGPD
jgi:hypothetical protein